MDWFGKALTLTLTCGFALMGIYVGLLILQLGVEVVETLLGSALGTIMLMVAIWVAYKTFVAG